MDSLGFMVMYSRKENAKVKAAGRTLGLLTLLVAAGKCLAERVSNEKGVSLESAEDMVVDCLRDGMRMMKA